MGEAAQGRGARRLGARQPPLRHDARPLGHTDRGASERVLPDAWAKASGDGKYPASARQVYYAARQPLQDITGKPVDYNYFSQTLLPDYHRAARPRLGRRL